VFLSLSANLLRKTNIVNLTKIKCLTAILLAVSCRTGVLERDLHTPVSVGISCRESSSTTTKTETSIDGLSTLWKAGDKVYLWVTDEGGSRYLNQCEFKLYAANGSSGWFTTTLQSPMPEGEYTYFASYPKPLSASSYSAKFEIPDHQNGLASNGADVMVSTPCAARELTDLSDPDCQDGPSLEFKHLIHMLRFYIPQGANTLGEPVEKMEITFPSPVAGSVDVGITDGNVFYYDLSAKTIVLDLDESLGESNSQDRNYAFAAIAPHHFGTDEKMQVRLFSHSKVCQTAPVSLKGRNMLAGHATAVALYPQEASNYCSIEIFVDSNNLGENVDYITLTAPQGCKWADSGSNTVVLHPQEGDGISAGYHALLEYSDQQSYLTLSKASVTVTYDSEHVKMSRTITMPDMSDNFKVGIHLDIPYLMNEDFSSVPSFSSNDAYSGGSVAGSKDAYSFMNGWAGGRIGASAGESVRLACRRETSADYDSRLDSAPIGATIKKTCNLSVSFDYGANNQYGGIAIGTDGNVGQTCFTGYITTTSNYKSGDTDGTYDKSNSFYIKEYTGTYSNTPHRRNLVISGVEPTDVFRLSFRTEVEHRAGTTNTTAWLYIDNIKIQITQ